MADKKKPTVTHRTITVSVETYAALEKIKRLVEKDLGAELSWEQVLARWAMVLNRWAAEEGK